MPGVGGYGELSRGRPATRIPRARHDCPPSRLVARAIWRTVAGFTPLAYHPPVALLALLLIAPAALLAANVLAAWPQRRAARLHAGQILRSE
jgi:hypothetical protein